LVDLEVRQTAGARRPSSVRGIRCDRVPASVPRDRRGDGEACFVGEATVFAGLVNPTAGVVHCLKRSPGPGRANPRFIRGLGSEILARFSASVASLVHQYQRNRRHRTGRPVASIGSAKTWNNVRWLIGPTGEHAFGQIEPEAGVPLSAPPATENTAISPRPQKLPRPPFCRAAWRVHDNTIAAGRPAATRPSARWRREPWRHEVAFFCSSP